MSQFKDDLLGSNLSLDTLVAISSLTEEDTKEIREATRKAVEIKYALEKIASSSCEDLAIVVRSIGPESRERIREVFRIFEHLAAKTDNESVLVEEEGEKVETTCEFPPSEDDEEKLSAPIISLIPDRWKMHIPLDFKKTLCDQPVRVLFDTDLLKERDGFGPASLSYFYCCLCNYFGYDRIEIVDSKTGNMRLRPRRKEIYLKYFEEVMARFGPNSENMRDAEKLSAPLDVLKHPFGRIFRCDYLKLRDQMGLNYVGELFDIDFHKENGFKGLKEKDRDRGYANCYHVTYHNPLRSFNTGRIYLALCDYFNYDRIEIDDETGRMKLLPPM